MKKFLLVLATLVLSLQSTTVLSTTLGIKTKQAPGTYVTCQQVSSFLNGTGYSTISIESIPNSPDYSCHTIKNGVHYTTIVHTADTAILGHEDFPYSVSSNNQISSSN